MMVSTTAGECKKKFSDVIELHDLYFTTVLDCQARVCSVFAKAISQTEAAVFGDYKILAFNRKSYVGEERSYAAITVRKNFCEIVPFASEENAEITAVLLLEPSCGFNYVNYDHHHPFWKVEVQGEINLTGTKNEPAEATDNTEEIKETPDYSYPQNLEEKPLDSHVWQFEGNDDVSVEQLMDMDLESLKNFGNHTTL